MKRLDQLEKINVDENRTGVKYQLKPGQFLFVGGFKKYNFEMRREKINENINKSPKQE